jgi:uncharacterized protein YecE (DUF72 family)
MFWIEPARGLVYLRRMVFNREPFVARLRALAGQGVFIGTSSWKYPGWLDVIYERDRYIWRGRFSEARFERNCLAEYAEIFSTVSVDASYYQFFKAETLAALAGQVPDRFQFAFKVCADITLKTFPQQPRYGSRAGSLNPHFLDAPLFTDAVLARHESIRNKVGLFMFEFSRFHPGEFARGSEFLAALDEFLGQLPRGWPYGVELRNRQWLQPEYFAVLARHGVTHIFNAWTDMPPVEEQLALPGSESNPSLLAARFLLREGRKYEAAVRAFSPYQEIQDPNPAGRGAAVVLARRGTQSGGRTKVMLFVNNRYEGHSPGTIISILDQLSAEA